MENIPFNDASYEQFVAEGKLMATRCRECVALSFPPRHMCAVCADSELEWLELKGTGRLAAYTSIVVAPPEMVAAGYDRNNPYVVGVVALDEGVRAVGRILGVDAKNPENIKVGTVVEAVFPEATSEPLRRGRLFFRATGK